MGEKESAGPLPGVVVRRGLGPGDLGGIVRLHGLCYAREHGFTRDFEVYVARPLCDFALRTDPGEAVWVVEAAGEVAGAVALVRAGEGVAQLRWFILAPALRGRGLGTRLLDQALGFARERGYARVILWTVGELAPAVRLYRRAGFRLEETMSHPLWGAVRREELYGLALDADQGAEGAGGVPAR